MNELCWCHMILSCALRARGKVEFSTVFEAAS